MKKFLIAAAIIAGLGISASAKVDINWNTVTEPVKLADGTTDAPTDYLAVLMWSADDVIDALDPADPLGMGAGAADKFLASQPMNGFGLDGFILGAQSPYSFADDTLAGGYVYSRVFDNANPTIGTMYGETSNVSRQLTVTTNDPTTLNPFEPLGIIVNMEIIPEPSTLALLAVGLGTVLFRRRR